MRAREHGPIGASHACAWRLCTVHHGLHDVAWSMQLPWTDPIYFAFYIVFVDFSLPGDVANRNWVWFTIWTVHTWSTNAVLCHLTVEVTCSEDLMGQELL